ncbi:hypothetical protein TL16_g11752 [Triparma laevis f. inornata]|uniref:Uncharacterized protein n=1 Tax=Triparma laevis f. inornata TaxID=1714386 RepID=A0A9W7BGM8_9STRA|nr:hypothetical protein TL16_g11752 [Triparma laevis f. inornata]
MTIPTPHSTVSKKLTLILSKGMIVLQKLQFGQTLLTFSAQVEVGKEVYLDVGRSASIRVTGLTSKTGIGSTASGKGFKKKKKVGGQADKLFCEIGTLLYERYWDEGGK